MRAPPCLVASHPQAANPGKGGNTRIQAAAKKDGRGGWTSQDQVGRGGQRMLCGQKCGYPFKLDRFPNVVDVSPHISSLAPTQEVAKMRSRPATRPARCSPSCVVRVAATLRLISCMLWLEVAIAVTTTTQRPDRIRVQDGQVVDMDASTSTVGSHAGVPGGVPPMPSARDAQRAEEAELPVRVATLVVGTSLGIMNGSRPLAAKQPQS